MDLCGRAAAIRAGYGKGGAHARASELLAKKHIRTRIAALQAKRLAENNVTAERVIKELARFAFRGPTGNPSDDKNVIASLTVLSKVLGMQRDAVQVDAPPNVVPISALGLTIEQKKTILAAVRKVRADNTLVADE